MKKRWLQICVTVFFAVAFTGCQTVREHPGAATGAAVGAAAGALAGSAMGDRDAANVVIGGIIGGILGGAVGHYAYDRRRSREETIDKYNYEPGTASELRIESLDVQPQSVRRGQSVDITLVYAVLTPDSDVEVQVSEIREIRHEGKLIGQPQIIVTRMGGTYSSIVPVTLSQKADTGEYTVLATVSAGDVSASSATTFTVR